MAKYDKENKADIDQLEQNLQYMKDKDSDAYKIQKAELAKKRQERMAYEAEARRAYPDARTNAEDTNKPSGGISYSSPDIEDRVNKYK
jgi:hypothetical protein